MAQMSLTEQAVRNVAASADRDAELLAARMGPAIGTQSVAEKREQKLYGQRDQSVDRESLIQAMTTTGLDPSFLDPQSKTAFALIKLHPSMAQFFAEPVAPEMAEQLAWLAEYPNRVGIWDHYVKIDPEEAVKHMTRLYERWSEEQMASQAEAPPMMQEQVAAPAPSPLTAAGPEAVSAPTMPPDAAMMMGG